MVRIAILEDDPVHAQAIQTPMGEAGYACQWFADGRALLRDLQRNTYDLFILDWQVPHLNGAEVLGWIRRNLSATVPVIFVTSRGYEQDIVEGLQAGADDYMVKPIRPFELKARVAALLRRAYPDIDKPEDIEIGPYVLYQQTRQVTRNGDPIELKPKEFALTQLLFRNIGRLLTHDYLLQELWGTSNIDSRTVTTHISQLRQKLDLRPHNGVKLSPVYGLGYRLEALETATTETPESSH